MEYTIRKLTINDFKYFREVFLIWANYPFWELWTEEGYVEEFMDFIESGEIYGMFLGDTICGLATIKENYLKWDELKDVVDVENSVYLSDIAVRDEFRGRGLGRSLMDYVVTKFGDDKDIYMRTNLVDSMSEGIAIDYDFRIYLDKIQEVSFERTNPNVPEKDLRKYLFREKNSNIKSLKRVA